MRVTLMHNPTAGQGQHSKDKLLGALRELGYDAVYQSTKDKDYARALQDPGDLVIAAGGDGTVAKVATHLVGRGVPISILPLGTANNIAKTLGITDQQQLTTGWAISRRKQFDIGVVTGPSGGTRFLESVGIGLFTQLILEPAAQEDKDGNRSPSRQAQLDHVVRQLQRILQDCPARDINITLDGQDCSGQYLFAEVMNIRFIGPNLCLAPDADPGDGYLDLVLLAEDERAELAHYLANRLEGKDAPLHLRTQRGRQVQITWDGSGIHVDDEIFPEKEAQFWQYTAPTTLDIRLEQHALEVFMAS